MFKSLRAQTLHYFARPHEGIPTAPVQTAAAWRGSEMRKKGDWTLTLSAAEIAEIKTATAHAMATGKPMAELGKDDLPLPTLSARIAEWRREIRHGRGFVLIRGVPVSEWSERESETFYWLFGHHFGTPGAQNPENDLLGHVRDQRTGEDVRFYRTNKAIAVHCDAADFVGLLCLKPAKSGGMSRIASSVAVFNELLRRKPQLAPRLFQPIYFDTKGEGGLRAFPIEPCRYAGGELRTFWQSDYYRSAQQIPHVPKLSAGEHELMDVYDGIANDPEFHLDMELLPGDIQLISNHTILHARTDFEDYPEFERRRHLLRLWISIPEKKSLKDLWLKTRSTVPLVTAAARELVLEKFRSQTGPQHAK